MKELSFVIQLSVPENENEVEILDELRVALLKVIALVGIGAESFVVSVIRDTD